MTGLDKLRDALLGVLPNVAHGHGHKLEPPYIIWQEESLQDEIGDDVVQDQLAQGSVGLYLASEDWDLQARVHQALMDVGVCELVDSHWMDELGLHEVLWSFEVFI